MIIIKNGYLYNGYAIQGVTNSGNGKNIANSNAHVPTKAEYSSLITYIGGLNYGGKLKDASLDYWNNNTGVTNDYGFSLRASGYRHKDNGNYYGLKDWAYLWTSEASSQGLWALNNYGSNNNLQWEDKPFKYALSLRLIVDLPIEINGNKAIYVGNDGQRYKCVLINGVWWTAENLIESRYQDGTLIESCEDPAVFMALTTDGRMAYNNTMSSAYVDEATPGSITASVTVQPNKDCYTGTIVVSDPVGASYEYSLDGVNWQSSPTFSGVHFGTYYAYCRIVGNSAYVTSGLLTVNEYRYAFNKKQVTIVGAILDNDGVNGTFGGNCYHDFESNYAFPITLEYWSKFVNYADNSVTENKLSTITTNSQSEAGDGGILKSISSPELENNFHWELYVNIIYNDGSVQTEKVVLAETEKTGSEVKEYRTLNVTGQIYPNYVFDGVDFQVQTSDLVGGQLFGQDILDKNIFAIELFDKNLASIGILNCYCISKGTTNFTLFIPQLAYQFRKFKLFKIGKYYLNNPLEKDSNNGYPMLDDYRLQVLISGSQATQNRGIRFTNLFNIVTQMTLTFEKVSNPGTVKYYTTYIDREREIGHTFNIYDHYVHDGILKSLFEWQGNGEYRLKQYSVDVYGGYTNTLSRPIFYNLDSTFQLKTISCDYRIDVNFQFGNSTKKQLNINDPMTKDEVVHVFQQYDSSVHGAKLNRYFITNSLKNKGILFLKNAVLFGTNDTTKATAVFKLGGIQVYKSDEIYAQVFELLFDEVTITGGTMNAIVYEPKFN